MSEKKYYITTTLPYVNAKPHIGFALEIVRADALARWRNLLGEDVFFNTGVDEHGQKIYEKAKEQEIEPKVYCDKMSDQFHALKETLNLSYNSFIRTTNPQHIRAAQAFWEKCEANGDIYKKEYKVKYCVGCELEKTESELKDGHCPLHPDKELELREEDNYFFRFSEYQDKLLKFYEDNPDFVVPDHRFNEIKRFVEKGLQDFSISRLRAKMPWGVPVPGDDKHVMYVWFDALINYISCLGWPDEKEMFAGFWPGYQICGKDNLRQQTAMWQAMLMSAGLPNSKQILVNGFINVEGQKMSKSLGNVVDPFELVEKYGVEAVRYYLLGYINAFADSDFSYDHLEAVYSADLANGLGNLVSRVSNLMEKNDITANLETESEESLQSSIDEKMKAYDFNAALGRIREVVDHLNEELTDKKPWKLENKEEIEQILSPMAQRLLSLSVVLRPFMPDTAAKISGVFSQAKVKKSEPLFPRIN